MQASHGFSTLSSARYRDLAEPVRDSPRSTEIHLAGSQRNSLHVLRVLKHSTYVARKLGQAMAATAGVCPSDPDGGRDLKGSKYPNVSNYQHQRGGALRDANHIGHHAYIAYAHACGICTCIHTHTWLPYMNKFNHACIIFTKKHKDIMHACMHACIHAYIHMCMHSCMYACMHTYTFIPTHIRTVVRTVVCVYVCVICICVYVYVYLYLDLCVYI